MTLSRIKVKGTPYECGVQMGQQMGDKIIKCVEIYSELFEEKAKISWEKARERASIYLPAIKAYDPDLLDEMQGIADAVELTLLDIVALNARSEVIFSAEAVDGCTSLSVVPSASGGETYLAQNWDHVVKLRECIILLEIEQENKPKILMVTEAGIIGKIGMNEYGLGVCLNALGSEGSIEGLPIHLALRGVLNSRNIGEAIGASIQHKSANAANFHIASKEGVAVNIELANDGYSVMFNEGTLAHTNHFMDPRLIYVKDRLQEVLPDTHIRLGVAKQLLGTIKNRKIGISELKHILMNHVNYPDSICRHGESAQLPLGKRGSSLDTIFSVIFELNAGKMHLAFGPPCETEYREYTFS